MRELTEGQRHTIAHPWHIDDSDDLEAPHDQ
jgi:hypothetical protein